MGVDLIATVIQQWVHTNDLQWVILGTGEQRYHQLFSRLADLYPRKVAARLEFSNALAHRIEAAADMFLMPSSFEPCGLSQMIDMRYATLPVVTRTGGLADTVIDAEDPKAGNGFVAPEATVAVTPSESRSSRFHPWSRTRVSPLKAWRPT